MIVILVLLWMVGVEGYPWGAPDCGPPQHPGGFSSSNSDLSLSLDNSNRIILSSSSSSFKGFLMTTDLGLSFSSPSTNSGVTSVCDQSHQNAAVNNINSKSRSMTMATINCASSQGQSFRVTAYVVYSYNSAYKSISKSFTCPISSSSTTTAGPTQSGSGSTTSLIPSSSVGQFDGLGGMVTIQWSPTLVVIGRRLSEHTTSGYSDIQVYFNLQQYTSGWMGVGFGYNDGLMTGGKKTIVLTQDGTTGQCSISFFVMMNHALDPIGSQDTWGISPYCSVINPSLVMMAFTIGGSSSITLPPAGTKIYTMIAGGLRVALGAHGSNKQVVQVDFLSSDSPSSSMPVNPYYYWHGILFIVNFAILMPLTAFLILINRSRFYTLHKWIGVLIVLILASGWILVVPGQNGKEEGNYNSFSSSSVGMTHKSFGSIGCVVASVVCAGGVVLWVIRLPPTMRKMVRYIHGIAGVALSFFGPYVVWTGWVQLQIQVPPTAALTDYPWAWLSLAITLGGIYIGWFILIGRHKKRSRDVPFLSRQDVDRLIQEGRLILIINGQVCEIPKTFSHPGGRSVLEQHSGSDVSSIMSGRDSFTKNGGMRNYTHSTNALTQAGEMAIGRLASAPFIELQPSVLTVSEIEGVIQSMDQVNLAKDFPVRIFRVRLGGAGSGIQLGSRVFLSIPSDDDNIERQYTVCRTDGRFIVEFCIKIYPEGSLTRKLNRLKPGQSVLLSNPVLHAPIPSVPSAPALAVFLAGGTGVTPMISYFSECARIAHGGVLLWWVRHEADLFLVSELQEWGRLYNVRIEFCFTQPASGHVRNGRISAQYILEVFGGTLPVDVSDIAWIMSGPEGFIKAAHDTLNCLNVGSTRILALD